MDVRKKNNIVRPDMINILMQVREGTLQRNDADDKKVKEGFATVQESDIGRSTVNRNWNDDEIVSQCFSFFGAGFETVATFLIFAAYEIAANPDVQQKLYEEIADTNEQLVGKSITYDTLQKMRYLDQFVCEVLRRWPPATVIDRVCTKDYVYNDGKNTKFTLEKGDMIMIIVYSVHHDPKYFSEPEKFDPDRFSGDNKGKIQPGTYIPFGTGKYFYEFTCTCDVCLKHFSNEF